jgi:hypothetical protein
MFARYTTETGALIADMIEEEPAPGPGETVIAMTPSAVQGITVWSAAARGYVDPPAPIPLLDYMRLWTFAERTAVRTTTNEILADAYNLMLASPIISLSHPDVLAGIDLAKTLDILTDERAARIKAGLPPVA